MQSTSTINVALTAIQNEFLVLETLDDQKLIYWPLKNLSQPIKIGNRLTLELKHHDTDQASISDPSLESTSSSPILHNLKTTSPLHQHSEEYFKHARLCKMLEELVN